MSTQALTIAGQQVTIADRTFGGAVNDKGVLKGARIYIAEQAGLDPDAHKEMKDLRLALGNDRVKALGKDYDQKRDSFYGSGKKLAALAAADPSMRCETRVAVGKNGVIGFNTKFRFAKENAAAKSKNERIAELERKLEAAAAVIAKLGLPQS